MFLVLDGVDCSGKTTVIKKYIDALTKVGYEVKQFTAIGEAEHGQALRKLVLNYNNNRFNPFSESLLFIAAIEDCYSNHIQPWIESGGVAVLDRYVYSTFIYQSIYWGKYYSNTANSEHSPKYTAVLKAIESLPIPDASYILDVSLETMQENMKDRGKLDDMDKFCADNSASMIAKYANLKHSPVFKDHNFIYLNNNRPYPNEELDRNIRSNILSCLTW